MGRRSTDEHLHWRRVRTGLRYQPTAISRACGTKLGYGDTTLGYVGTKGACAVLSLGTRGTCAVLGWKAAVLSVGILVLEAAVLSLGILVPEAAVLSLGTRVPEAA
eukprot:49848-Rhodomonas_salina.1